MYTAKIKTKEIIDGVMNVTVDFSDGTTTVTETCKPQDKNGFVFWVKSRLATFNGSQEIDTDYNVDDVVDTTDPTPTPPTPTQAELDERQWFADYLRYVKVKTTLVDTGVVSADNPKVTALLNKVKTNLKAEYVDKL